MPLVQADARAIPLEDQSVQCVVTSPPYWGLRDYGQVGQLGLEKTPEEYVEKMVTVFREIWRVLRDDGTCWVNMGDSYVAGQGGRQSAAGEMPSATLTIKPNPRIRDDIDTASWAHRDATTKTTPARGTTVLKPKDLAGIPWRLAFALQADGWYLRADIIWAKGLSFCDSYSGSVMPESVTDRPTKGHEYLFLLTKKAKYYYDNEAVKEVGAIASGTRAAKGSNVRSELKDVNSRAPEYWDYTGTRNLRSVWAIGTKPFKAAHFATFPPKLVEPCIKAGTSEKGCCGECGGPWVRVVERSGLKGEAVIQETERPAARERGVSETSALRTNGRTWRESQTTGWRPSCTCPDPSPLPCIVLDPFAGSGTVGLVCRDLKRLGVCCDLKLDYLHMARERLR